LDDAWVRKIAQHQQEVSSTKFTEAGIFY